MSRRAGNVSIKQLSSSTNNEGETVIAGPNIVNDTGDVEQVIQSMINSDTILDENDVNTIVNNKLTNYTTTNNLESNYLKLR